MIVVLCLLYTGAPPVAGARADDLISYSHQQEAASCRQPLPPVTFVFAEVMGAHSLAHKHHKTELQSLNKAIRRCMLQLTTDLPGGDGYMCRSHEADLRYLVAFESPVNAVQWCLLVSVRTRGREQGIGWRGREGRQVLVVACGGATEGCGLGANRLLSGRFNALAACVFRTCVRAQFSASPLVSRLCCCPPPPLSHTYTHRRRSCIWITPSTSSTCRASRKSQTPIQVYSQTVLSGQDSMCVGIAKGARGS